MEVQTISQKLIKPSLPTPPHLQNLTLSFLDLRLSPRTVPLIFYYPNHHHPHPLNSNLLTKSLSNILTLFYPLAGRYIKQTSCIKCNDEGIQYSEALVNTELSQILKGQFQVHELNSFVPHDTRVLQESDTSPLLAIQVNIFKCGGLAIGVVNSHRIVDGFTLYLFMNGWAKACKTEDLSDFKVPTFKSGEFFPPRQKDQIFTLPSISVSRSELVTERLVLKAKEKITTSVVIAVIWRAQIKAARARHGVPRSSLLSIAVDLRGKIKRKLPENCCGNFVTYGIGRFEVEDHEKEMSLSVFVDKVRDVIKKTISEVNGDGDLYELVMTSTRELAEEAGKGEGDIHRFSSGRDFPTYAVDFGWGKPAWVSHAKRVYKSVLIVDSRDGDGVEAWVTMDKEELGYFRDCLDVSSSIFLNNGRTKLGYFKISLVCDH